MRPLLSILITTYRQGEFLQETLDSVGQLRGDFAREVLLVDDASPDACTQQLLEALALQPELRVLRLTHNEGVSAARNYAAQQAQGKYLLFLDGDDRLHPDFLLETLPLLEENPQILCVRTAVEFFGAAKGRMDLGDYSYAKLLARNRMVLSCPLRREHFLQMGGFDTDFRQGLEDWEFWIHYLRDGGEVATVDKPLFFYRIRANSRNRMSATTEDALRLQIYHKHRRAWAEHFVAPRETIEYQQLLHSRAYRLGKKLLTLLNRIGLWRE